MIRHIRLIGLLLIIAATASHAANKYVRPTAQGSENGSDWNNAWSMSGISWASVSPGDTVWFSGGNYSSAPNLGKSGTSAAKITLRRVTSSDATPVGAAGYSAAFNATAAFGNNWPGSIAVSYFVFDGGTTNGATFTVPSGQTYDFDFDGYQRTTVAGCELRHCRFNGPGWGPAESYAIRCRVTTGFLIKDCFFTGIKQVITMNGATDTTVEGSTFLDVGDASNGNAHPDVIYGDGVNGLHFRFNVVSNVEAEAIFFERNASDVRIYGNVLHRGVALPGTICVGPKQEASHGAFLIYNNTFIGWGNSCMWRGAMSPAPVLRNNIFWQTSWSPYGDYIGDTPVSQYNGYSGQNQDGTGGYSSATDPFVSGAAGNYRLKAGAWPIGRGTSLGSPYNADMDGTTRGEGGTWDMGAFEYASGVVSTNPVIEVTPATLAFAAALEGTVATNSFSVQNIGAGTLTGSASISGSALGFELLNTDYSLTAGQSTSINVRCTYGASDATKQVDFSGGGGSTNYASATTTALLGEYFLATNGVLTAGALQSWQTTGGYLSQASETSDASGTNDGGRAVYWFTITNAGHYRLRAYSAAPHAGANSSYVGIDAWPDTPLSVWDQTNMGGFVTNYVNWRGTGTPDAPQFSPMVWSNLDAGVHELIVVGREPNMQLRSFELVPLADSATAPVITQQPTSQSVIQGQAASFTVTATGTATLAYQWRKNGADIGSATDSGYSIANAQSADAGSFAVVVTNAAGAVTSATAVLTVNIAPGFSAQPASVTNIVGRTNQFACIATGSSPLAYQWTRDAANVSGATAAAYTIAGLTTNDAGSYCVVVTNAAGAITSATAVLTVADPPYILSFPSGPMSVFVGSNITATVSAGGFPPLQYRWRFNSTNLLWPGYGATITAIAATNYAGNWDVIVSNIAGSVTSSPIVLTVSVNEPAAPSTNLPLVIWSKFYRR